MKKSLFLFFLLPAACPTAAAVCDVIELWHSLDAAEKAVYECNQRLRFFDANHATAEACISAKISWIHHATVVESCLQDAISAAALLGDDLHEFIERGKEMNDMQRINNTLIKAKTAALANDREPEADISRNVF
jgi:hypothetical protein